MRSASSPITRLKLNSLHRFTNLAALSELAAACAMALVLYLTWHRSRTPFGLPVILIGGVHRRASGVLDHRHLAGSGPRDRVDIPAAATVHLHVAVEYRRARRVSLEHGARPARQPDCGRFRHRVSTLFNTTGIEVSVHREANLERELNVTGFANILTGALGGYAGCISVSRTILNFGAAAGRLSGTDSCGHVVPDAVGRARPARLHAEIRARRAADLSGRRPAA